MFHRTMSLHMRKARAELKIFGVVIDPKESDVKTLYHLIVIWGIMSVITNEGSHPRCAMVVTSLEIIEAIRGDVHNLPGCLPAHSRSCVSIYNICSSSYIIT